MTALTVMPNSKTGSNPARLASLRVCSGVLYEILPSVC